MRRETYVDNKGNTIDHEFQSKKAILNIFFIIGTIVPLIIIGFMVYQMVINYNCNKINNNIKTATLEYLKDKEKLPELEGDSIKISLDKLYSGKYLSSLKTDNNVCSGIVKTTKYKNKYIYTLDLTSCNLCTTSKKYSGWSAESKYYPKNKPIIDVTPYYNYYNREINTTEWSKYYEPDKLDTKESKYNIKLPADTTNMPEVPKEGNVVEVQKEEKTYYRYTDQIWKWYDIPGDYSNFSSEQPAGYALKDDRAKRETEWSAYSLSAPEEQPYRSVKKTTGYKFYYEKDGKKVYANHEQYTPAEEVDQKKYNKRDDESSELYSYRDEQWRWYNGTRRRYSSGSSAMPAGYSYRDEDTVTKTSFSSWNEMSKLNPSNQHYRTEETMVKTRFRYVYEILSAPIFEIPLTRTEFVKQVKTDIPDFITKTEYKTEVTYKFRYRKS